MNNAITQQIIAINHERLVASVETMRAALNDCQGERVRIVLTQNLEQARATLDAYRAQHGIEVEATPSDAINNAMDMASEGMVELSGLAARMLATAMDEATGGCHVVSLCWCVVLFPFDVSKCTDDLIICQHLFL